MMIKWITSILILLAPFISQAEKYEYAGYYGSGEMSWFVFDISNGRISMGNAILDNIVYKDCSNTKFKCIETGNEIYFAPRIINRSGEYTSPFGNYEIYSNKQRLPFNTNIEYKIIKIYPYFSEVKTIFYNTQKGVLAILEEDKQHQFASHIAWLMSQCGLLSDEDCLEEVE